jgi:hypothetical protein
MFTDVLEENAALIFNREEWSLFYPENGGKMFRPNVGKYPPDYKAPHPST